MNARAHFPTTDAAAPRDLRTEGGGGKIYPVDPAAWEHFKAVMAQQQDRPRQERKPTGIKRNGRLDADLQRKVDELRERARQKAGAQEDSSMPRPQKMTDDEIIAAHRRYVLEFTSVLATAETTPLGETPLKKRFDKLELPVRDHSGRFSPAEIERICAVHRIEPEEILMKGSDPDPAKPAEYRVVWREGAPVPNGEQTAVSPGPRAVIANGSAPAVTMPDPHDNGIDIGEQLALLSDLLAQANAQSVTLTGRISIQLQAEVIF